MVAAVLLAAGAFLAIRQPWRRLPTGAETPAISIPHPDVLLITIDTLRADALGFAGNSRVSTPTLDRLAKEGLVFTSAHAHNVVTLPSHANILTGLYPYQHGVRDNTGFRLDAKVPTLATMLKARGYATGAFVGAFPLDSRFGLESGFDLYDDRYPKGKGGLDFEMAERPASEVVAAARRWFNANQGKRRFLWIHVYDPHAPYRPPPPFSERYRREPYLGEVAATDAAIEPLLEPFLSRQSPPALIVVTADHGESLGDHGEETHGLFAYEETLRVPLILWLPGTVAPGVRADVVGHIDLVPTVLGLLGIEKPTELSGRSLLSSDARAPERTYYFEAFSAAYNRGWAPLRGVLGQGHKLIELPLPEVYDLEDDPRETRNLVSERRDVARKLRGAIPGESAIGAAPRPGPASEEAARLRSLGYLTGSAAIRKSYTAEDDPKTLVHLDRQIHRSIDLYQRGDVSGATSVARRLVEMRPTMTLAYENLAFLLRQSGNVPAALAVYRTALDRGIGGEELRKNFALALSEVGGGAEAVRILQPLSQSSNPDVWNALGIALADSGRAPDAIRAFEQALRFDPDNAEAYENMGIVRLRAQDPSGARDLFLRALALDKSLPRAWNGLGVAQARLGHSSDALASWEEAIALDSRLYDALFNIGLTAAKNGAPRQARHALERFVKTAPPSLYRGDIEEARRLLAALAAAGS